MATERRAATLFDRRHDLELAQADVTVLGSAPGRSVGAEDIGDFKDGALHDAPLSKVACSPED
jgi:hypothetical protein